MHDGLLAWFRVFVAPGSECNLQGKKRGKKSTHELKTRWSSELVFQTLKSRFIYNFLG